MKNPLPYFAILAKRWAWLILLGVLICGGVTYALTKFMSPIYEASATLFVKVCSSQSSANDCLSASTGAVPTYAQLVTNPIVLNPVVAQHPGLTLKQLDSMISVKPQSNTQLIELDVDDKDPQLATQLANQVSQSFATFSNNRLPGVIQVLPAQQPVDPIKPKPTLYAAIGALVGLALAVALIVIFEWIDDRLTRPEEAQELLGMETLAIIPKLSRRQRFKKVEEIPALLEAYRKLCANLNALQAVRPFKLIMVTSALVGEGRSTVATNLASFLAMTGKQVLLVDADLRNPVLDSHFQLDNRQGLLSTFLEIWAELEVNLVGQATEIPTLHVLTSGVIPSNSVELLQSSFANQLFEHFKKAQFDYIIFDASPLLPVADAKILASRVQATILVVDAAKTSRRVLVCAKRELSKTRTLLLGAILNKSQWMDYDDPRLYQSRIQQLGIDFTQTMPPSTPSLNNGREPDSDATVIVPHQS